MTLKEGVCAESLGRKKVLFEAFNAAGKAAKTRRSRERTASKKINDVQFKQFLQWANEPEQGLQVKDLDQFINFRKLEKLVQCTLPASYKHFDKMMWVVLESFAQMESVSECADVLSFMVDMFNYPPGIDCAKSGQPELVPIVRLNPPPFLTCNQKRKFEIVRTAKHYFNVFRKEHKIVHTLNGFLCDFSFGYMLNL